MIEIRNLVKCFGPITAVDDVSFRVEKGDVLAFLGPNGAGKSTTMRVITGYLHQDSGSVHVGGHDMREEPMLGKALIGYLPESAPLYEEMKVRAFLEFSAALRKLDGRRRKEAVDRSIETCQLNGVANQSINTLSKGYRHRTCFAQALLHDPPILILDEPTDGLDPNQKHEMRDLIKTMGEEKAIVVSTHILEEVDAACNRVAILNNGKLVFNGAPDELRAQSPTAGILKMTFQAHNEKVLVEQLYTVPAVRKIDVLKAEDGVIRIQIIPDPAYPDFVSQVARLCHQAQWLILEMTTEDGELDEVFRTVTQGGKT